MSRSSGWVVLATVALCAPLAWVGCSKDGTIDLSDGSVPRDVGSAADASSDVGAGGDQATDQATADTGVDGGADDQGFDAGPVGRDLYVSSTLGNDLNGLGTQASPYRTLDHTLGLATAGDTVWLMDGTWDSSVDSRLAGISAVPCGVSGIPVAAGVTLRAVNAGAATVSISGSFGLCTNGGDIHDVVFARSAGGGVALLAQSGDSLLSGVAFTSATDGRSAWMVEVQGGAHMTWTPGGLTRYATGTGALAFVTGAGSELSVQGGAVDDVFGAPISNGAVFLATLGGRLVLDDVVVERPVANQTAVAIAGARVDGGVIELRGTTALRGFNTAQGLWIQGGAQALLTDDVVIEGNAYGVFASFSNVTPTQLTLSGNAAVQGNIQDGIRGDLISTHDLVLTITGNAVVDSNGGVGVLVTTGEVRMTGGSVSHNQQYGLSLSTGVRVFNLRNAFIHNNTFAGIYWTSLGSNADLGTLASPGGNTITVNGTATSNVNLFMDAPFVTAVGNTWNASVQGADAQGMFSGDVLLTGQIVNAGGNFRVNQAGQQLRLSGP